MNLARIAVVLGGLMLIALPADAQSIRNASVEEGAIMGQPASGDVTAFLGIPFASPPTGTGRWRAPLAPSKWQGVRQATSFGPSCIQGNQYARGPWSMEFFAPPPYSEDCLYLNVWTPAKTKDAKLPVAVYLPGGGFQQGGANEPIYHGADFAKNGILFLSLNYRLGALGFLAHPELTAESPARVSGNYALLDIIAALKWVKINIAAFGGDPDQVTLIGQSAGAAAISTLLGSPEARGLFQRAIAQSGLRIGEPLVVPLAEAERMGKAYGETIGAKTLAELRDTPAQRFISSPTVPFAASPVLDGKLIPVTLNAALAAAPITDVPVMFGYNSDEGIVRRPLTEAVPKAVFEKEALATYGTDSSAFLALYQTTGDDATAAAQASSHDWVMHGTTAWAAKRAVHAKAPLYAYEFKHVMPGYTAGEWGSFHTAEVPYAFQTLQSLDRPWTATDSDISNLVSSYWVNFIKTGNPNGGALPQWKVFDAKDNSVMRLSSAPGMAVLSKPNVAAFFGGFFDRKIVASP